jgi:hypothetical protein
LRRTSAAGYWSLGDATNIKDEIIRDQCRRKRTGRPTEMTQNITLDTEFFRDLITSLDLIEKSCRRVLEEVGEKIEAATVGHACRVKSQRSLIKIRERREGSNVPRTMC